MSLLLFQLISLLLTRSKLDFKRNHAADLCSTQLQQFWHHYAPPITIGHLLGEVLHTLQVSSERKQLTLYLIIVFHIHQFVQQVLLFAEVRWKQIPVFVYDLQEVERPTQCMEGSDPTSPIDNKQRRLGTSLGSII